MIVDKVWKLTNTVRVGLDARSSHAQRQSTFPDNVCSYCPPCHGVLHYENLTTFLSVSDDAGGKSLSDTSTSARGQCVGESSTGAKSTVIRIILSSSSGDVAFLTPRTTRGSLSII